MITVTTPTSSKLHWNYFLALEQDLDKTTRYIEFHESNLKVFSIELAHLLFAAASEVDVLAKCICEVIKPEASRNNIHEYQSIIYNSTKLPAPNISMLEIFIPRYGIKFKPWENWANNENPNWWDSYNNVKHKRNQYFHEATLQNALNALGALLVLNYHYCWLIHTKHLDDFGRSQPDTIIRVTRQLRPESTLLRLPEDCYTTAFDRAVEYL